MNGYPEVKPLCYQWLDSIAGGPRSGSFWAFLGPPLGMPNFRVARENPYEERLPHRGSGLRPRSQGLCVHDGDQRDYVSVETETLALIRRAGESKIHFLP